MGYARGDVTTVLPDFKRWFEQDIRGGGNKDCVVCGEEAGRHCARCSTCRARTCVDCFPNVVGSESDDVIFACPVCRKKSLAIDVLQPVIDESVRPTTVWAAMRKAIKRCGDGATGCVVAKHPFVVIVDAKVVRGRHIAFMSQHREIARELVTQPGCVIGIGRLPQRMSRTPSAIEVDPDGRGFVVGPDGQAYQLVKGWQYVLGVFVR